jgi:peptidoglycan/LPS O-acetylase OafA/YrhL
MHALDLLRGACSVGVAAYHLLNWQSVTKLDAIGLYAVYVFFVLSGASITFAYMRKLRTLNDFGSFIALRFVRLAPLYLTVLALAMTYRLVALDDEALALKLTSVFANLTMLFGLGSPGATALVIGGWSLGVEFLFYLLFPFYLLSLSVAASSPTRLAVVLGIAFALQMSFVHGVLEFGKADFSEKVFEYTQFAAFLAYFAGGCAVGAWLRLGSRKAWPAWAWIPAVLLLCGLFHTGEHSQSALLTGWQGGIRAAVTVLLVAVWSRLPVCGAMRPVATKLGDASYGLYLLHPLAFHATALFGLASLGGAVASGWGGVAALTIAVITVSFLSALVFHHFVEAPLLATGRARFLFGEDRQGVRPHPMSP